MNSLGRGYNLLTPEKLAVAKWLESVPETCSVADSILDYSNTRKAPIAETELFGSNVSSSDRVNSPDNNQGKDQLCASKHKFGGNEHYRNTSALMPVPENAEQDHVLKSHTLHSMSSDQYQNGPMRPCNPITPVSLSSVRLKSSDSQFPISYETNRINGRCASGLITSSKEKHNVANVVSVDGFSQLHRAQPGPTVFHTVDQSETGVIRFSKHAKLPSTKKFQPPGLFKWLLSRLHHIRLSWRRSHHSCFDDKIIDPQKRVISTRILNSKNEYYTHYPFENGVFEDYQMCRQSVSPNNLRRCFSLSDGGKTNKVDNQTVKNCCSGVDSSFFPSISKTESNISDHRKQSSYSYKDLHWISQKNLIESPSFISLTVSPLPISKNRFLNENRTGVKSAPRLLTSSPVLVRNFSKNDSKISVQDSSKTSTKRDSGFAEETHGPYVFGNVTQSCLLISPDDPHTYHNFKPSSSRKASPNSSNLWWYTGSNLLTPFGELPTRHFTTSYVKVSCD
ncbi:unnamed protein product [Heterobilharzia americana]|nr:unnamed protein product [Heterobilharzia americana]